MIEVATLQTLGGPDMGNGTFSALDMTTYCGLVELGLVAVGMRCQEGGFVLKCRAANPARCAVPGIVGSVVGRRPNTGARLGRLINQNSHVIWVP